MKTRTFLIIPWIVLYSFMNAYSQEFEPIVQKAKEYYDAERYDSAAVLFEQALPLIEHIYGSNDTGYYTKQVSLTAESFSNCQQYEKAKYYFTCVKTTLVSLGDTLSVGYATSISKLAKSLNALSDYETALSLYQKAMNIRKEKLGINHPEYASSLNNLAYTYDKLGDYDVALSLFQEALKIRKEVLGNNHIDYAQSLNNLTLLYNHLGRYNDAYPLCIEALRIIKETQGTAGPDYTMYLNTFAGLLRKMGKYDTAIILYKEAINIVRETSGENCIKYALTLNNMALVYNDIGKYESAVLLYQKAILVLRDILGECHPDYAASLDNLALLYMDMGNYEAALPLFEEAKQIRLEILGTEHIDYAYSLNNIALLYEYLGKYETSLLYFEECLKIFKQILGTKHLDYAITLDNMAGVYFKLGDFKEACDLNSEALLIIKEILGSSHKEYAFSLNNLGTSYRRMKDYNTALELFEQARCINQESLGIKHPQYARTLNNIAEVYCDIGNYDTALLLYTEVLSIRKEVLGSKHPDYAMTLNSLASLYYKLGDYNSALPLFEEAKKIRKEVLGSNHPKYAESVNNLAKLYEAMGNYMNSLTLYLEANKIINQNIHDYFSFLPQLEKEKFLASISTNYEVYLSFLYDFESFKKEFNYNAYNNELLLKGLVLNCVSTMQQEIYTSSDTIYKLKYEQLRVLNRQIYAQEQKIISKRRLDFDSLVQQAKLLERDLVRGSQAFNKMDSFLNVDWKDVQNRLCDNGGSIEFVTFQFYNGHSVTDSSLYCALFLSKTDTLPQFIFLCEEKQLQAALPATSADSKSIDPIYLGENLYNLIWKPIDSLLQGQGINTVYFAPSGLLNRVSMSAIKCPDGKLLSEKYNLVQLSSTRTLAMPEEPAAITDAAIYGGIKYDPDTNTWLASTGKYRKDESEVLAFNPPTFRGITRGGWAYLPGTKKEAGLVAEKLARNDIDTTTFTGVNALEESFYSLSGNNSPSIIHISTHGFYYPDTVSDEYRKNMLNSATGDIQFKYADDPLLRSGLIMAGGNNTWKGLQRPEGVEDGILTAREVSNMNLLNTELVVLSACQTGQGDVKGSEGVEGLQRGFKMAGVHYLIMSLWEVPDKETTEFMEHFYSLWPGDLSIRDAFRETQLKMMRKYPGEPHKWAGFVLME